MTALSASDRPSDAVLCDLDNVIHFYDLTHLARLERLAGLAEGATARVAYAPEVDLPLLLGKISKEEWVDSTVRRLAGEVSQLQTRELGTALAEAPFWADEVVVTMLRRARNTCVHQEFPGPGRSIVTSRRKIENVDDPVPPNVPSLESSTARHALGARTCANSCRMDPTTAPAANTYDINRKRPVSGGSMCSRRVLRLVTIPLMAALFSLGAASAASADGGADQGTGYETNLGALVGLGI
ncbi:hypothetical protein GCM10010211_58610 [Streptomyces albospinus]|uniref:Uncharacterized protein n=1 Tax=Streptomyces albospinus TaxID=285515 RepID=A0ABQ2VGC2_9ACTN|nr:hypothetical protein [Streptomyces albospinus]GGU84854.1 hypothetical protein GCM10010211_58610 [Streptomyces albospinus]